MVNIDVVKLIQIENPKLLFTEVQLLARERGYDIGEVEVINNWTYEDLPSINDIISNDRLDLIKLLHIVPSISEKEIIAFLTRIGYDKINDIDFSALKLIRNSESYLESGSISNWIFKYSEQRTNKGFDLAEVAEELAEELGLNEDNKNKLRAIYFRKQQEEGERINRQYEERRKLKNNEKLTVKQKALNLGCYLLIIYLVLFVISILFFPNLRDILSLPFDGIIYVFTILIALVLIGWAAGTIHDIVNFIFELLGKIYKVIDDFLKSKY